MKHEKEARNQAEQFFFFYLRTIEEKRKSQKLEMFMHLWMTGLISSRNKHEKQAHKQKTKTHSKEVKKKKEINAGTTFLLVLVIDDVTIHKPLALYRSSRFQEKT